MQLLATYYISIGLNVGPTEPADQETKTQHALRLLCANGHSVRSTIIEGEWEGLRERTVQARIVSYATANEMHLMLCSWARTLGQQCIAVVRPGDPGWTLCASDGSVGPGGTLAAYPLYLG